MDREKLWPYLRRNISDLYRSRIKSKLRDPVTKSRIPKKNPCVMQKTLWICLNMCAATCGKRKKAGIGGAMWSHVKPHPKSFWLVLYDRPWCRSPNPWSPPFRRWSKHHLSRAALSMVPELSSVCNYLQLLSKSYTNPKWSEKILSAKHEKHVLRFRWFFKLT